MQEGKRYLVERNGVQFAGTYNGAYLISDIDGTEMYDPTVIRELTGLEAMKAGDVVVHTDGREAKILAITNNHTAFLRSYIDESDAAKTWYTFAEAKKLGWKLKDQSDELIELTLDEVADKFNIPVDQLRIKD